MDDRTVAERVAEFTSSLSRADVPPCVWEKARRAILHNLSVAVAGERFAQTALAFGRQIAPPSAGGARTLVQGRTLSTGQAAFINACLMHARAQDDVFFAGFTHTGATTIPAALAVGEERDVTGDELLLAVIAGYEAACALSDGFAQDTTVHGFRASGIYGVFGAAAAAARLMRLDAEASMNAIAIAASFASGTNQTWLAGSQEWQYQVGGAARNGLQAALLADAGGKGAKDALEGKAGFYYAYFRDASGAVAVGRDLGKVWRSLDVTFKPYPVCAILQAPVHEVIRLRSAQPAGRNWRRAVLSLSPAEAEFPGVAAKGPFMDVGAALMSAAYCIAVALTEGRFASADLFRYDELGLIDAADRVELRSDSSMPPRSFRLDVDFEGTHESVNFRADNTTFNWDQRELEERVRMLRDEVPADIALDDLISATRGLEATSVRDLVGICIAAG